MSGWATCVRLSGMCPGWGLRWFNAAPRSAFVVVRNSRRMAVCSCAVFPPVREEGKKEGRKAFYQPRRLTGSLPWSRTVSQTSTEDRDCHPGLRGINAFSCCSSFIVWSKRGDYIFFVLPFFFRLFLVLPPFMTVRS